MPIAILKDSSGAAVGDAYLAGIGSGVFTDIRSTLANTVMIENRYRPDSKAHTYYQERYARYRSLYERVREEFDQSAASAEYKINK
jgi:xylulokinase